MMYVDGNSKVGEAEAFKCPHCKDGKLLKAWEKLVKGKDGLLTAYRLNKAPSEKTWELLASAKKSLGIKE